MISAKSQLSRQDLRPGPATCRVKTKLIDQHSCVLTVRPHGLSQMDLMKTTSSSNKEHAHEGTMLELTVLLSNEVFQCLLEQFCSCGINITPQTKLLLYSKFNAINVLRGISMDLTKVYSCFILTTILIELQGNSEAQG